jgi:hypothetical protein
MDKYENERDIVTLKLRFHRDRDDEYAVYRYLKNAEQSVTKTVINCVKGYQKTLADQEKEDRFFSRMEAVIQDNLKALLPLMNLLRLTTSAAAPPPPQAEAEERGIDKAKVEQMQDFLKAFEGDADDPEEGQE